MLTMQGKGRGGTQDASVGGGASAATTYGSFFKVVGVAVEPDTAA